MSEVRLKPARRLKRPIRALGRCVLATALAGFLFGSSEGRPARAAGDPAWLPMAAVDDGAGGPLLKDGLRLAQGSGLARQAGLCAGGAAGAGVQTKLCNILSGLLVRMQPLPEEASVVRLNRRDGVYHEGEFLVVTIDVPPELRTGHLHVVFIDQSGEVVHMLPNLYVKDTLVRGGQRVTLGVEEKERRRGRRDYRVTPPFGPGMVLAFVSPRPLKGLGRREVESMGSFLTALETALRSTEGEPIRFADVAIETRAR